MNIFESNTFSELKDMYSQKGMTEDDYSVLYNRFMNMSDLDEVKPFLYAMRYFGMGTEPNPTGVLNELKKMQLKDDIQLKGLACDLLLFQKEDERILSELKRMKEKGYSDIYLGEKSHIHKLVLLQMPQRGEQPYHGRLSCGVRHLCAINADNKLVSFGWNKFGQCNIEEWDTPTKICCDGISTFAIYEDSVKVAGALATEEHAITREWKHIVACKGTMSHVIGVNDIGHILFSGKGFYLYDEAQKWDNIIQVVTSGIGNIVALSKNGRLYSKKIRDPWGTTNVDSWEDVVQISGCTVGLKSDGTVLYAGNGLAGADAVSEWEGIVQVAATSDVTYGLLENGKVICTAYDAGKDQKSVAHDKGQRRVEEWDNIVSIWAGRDFVIGLRNNGKVLFAGDGSDGLDQVQGLQLFG